MKKDRFFHNEKLVSWQGMFPFILVILIAIAYAIPSIPELAGFYFNSFDTKKAFEVLSKSGSNSPRTISKKIDVLEYEGRYEEALLLISDLVNSKPHNLEYRQKYVKVLMGMGKTREAIYVSEQILELGLVKSTEKDYLKIAQDYEWIESRDDVMRVFGIMEKKGMMTMETLPRVVSILVTNKQADEALKLLDGYALKGFKATTLYRDIARVFVSDKEYEKFSYAAARALNLDMDSAKNASVSPSFIEKVADSSLSEFHPFVQDMINVYNLEKKYEYSSQLLARLEKLKLLSIDDQFSLVDVLIEMKNCENALSRLERIAKAYALSDSQWRMVARRLTSCRQNTAATAILKSLLDGETPQIRIIRDSASILRDRILKAISLISQFLISEAQAEPTKKQQKIVRKKDPQSRLKTYDLLVETQDANGLTDEALISLEKLITEIEEGKITVDHEAEVRYREMLAEHYSWHAKPMKAVQVLEPLTVTILTPNGLAVKAVAHFEASDVKKSEDAIRLITSEKRVLIKDDLRKRLSEVEDEISREAVARERNQDGANFESKAEVLTHNRASFELGYLATENHTMLSTHGGLEKEISKFSNGKLKILPYFDIYSFREMDDYIYEAGVGVGYALPRDVIELHAGYRGHTQTGKFPLRYRLSTSRFLDYFSIELALSSLVFGSDQIVRRGLNEYKGTIFVSHRFSPWVLVTAENITRTTNLGTTLYKGAGYEFASRVFIGKPTSKFFFGPWSHLVRWSGKGDESLNDLLVRRISTTGVLAKLDLGEEGALSTLKFDLTSGWGYNFSEKDRPAENFFTELNFEKQILKKLYSRLNAAYYTGLLNSSFRSGTVLGQFSLVYQL